MTLMQTLTLVPCFPPKYMFMSVCAHSCIGLMSWQITGSIADSLKLNFTTSVNAYTGFHLELVRKVLFMF